MGHVDILCFTESWLSPAVSDHAIQPTETLIVFRMERTEESGKSKGGEMCVKNQQQLV